MNLLDLVPSLKRQIGQYVKNHTDSELAGYIADGIDALNWKWTRSYEITYVQPHSYTVEPDITTRDKRPVILMAGIIYKMGNVGLASVRDGDFAYDPNASGQDLLARDLEELNTLVPTTVQLQAGFTRPLRGYSSIYNTESYIYWTELYRLVI